MKNKLTIIAGGLLGLMFVVFGLNFFLNFLPTPPPPEGTPAAAFIGAMYGTGFLTFVKVLELMGGVLVAVPKTRNIGLLILGPIIVNILAFHLIIARDGLQAPVILMSVIALFLLWSERIAFAGLIKKEHNKD